MALAECSEFRTAAQDRDIAGLERERARIRRHIGAAFIDDADHADGRGDARDVQTVGPRPARQFAANGIGQRRDILHALGHGFDARVIRAPAGPASRPPCRSPWPRPGRAHWRREFRLCAARMARGGFAQRLGLGRVIGFAHGARRVARGGADRHHLGRQAHRSASSVVQRHDFSVSARSSRWIISSRPR